MRCRACDRNLSDFESTRKDHDTGQFVDLCNQCMNDVNDDLSTDLFTNDRFDLKHNGDDLE
jgi:hypothetical protein